MRKSLLYSVLVTMTVLMGIFLYAPTVEAASKPKITTFTESNVNTGTKLKITFKSAGTKSYKVQISTKKSSGFKKVSYKKNDTGKNESYTIKKVGSTKIKENKTYYVRVTVYSKKNYKGVKTTKTYKVYSAPTTAKISVSKLTDSTAKISWKKVSGATKYQVKMNGKTDTQKGLSKSYTNLGASTDYTAMVRSYKQVKVNGKSVKLYSAWKTLKFQTAVSSDDSTANEIVYVDTLSYGEWQNVKTISTVKQSAEEEKTIEEEEVRNGASIKIFYSGADYNKDVYDNGYYTVDSDMGTVLGLGYNGKIIQYPGRNIEYTVIGGVLFGLNDTVIVSAMPSMAKIGTLTTETTPVYNVTTEDMSEAYRTVTTVTYYSDGTSKTSSTTQRYVDVYGTPTRSTSVLADESEWEVNYTYRINRYYAELFDEDGDGNNSSISEGIDFTRQGYGGYLWCTNNTWYVGTTDADKVLCTVIFE